jgi:hypothetical protein
MTLSDCDVDRIASAVASKLGAAGVGVDPVVAAVVNRWIEATTCVPLLLVKDGDRVKVYQAIPAERLTKAQFAAELSVSPNTFAKIEDRFGLAPDSGRMYSRETVEDVKRWLRNEETRVAPRARRAVG